MLSVTVLSTEKKMTGSEKMKMDDWRRWV